VQQLGFKRVKRGYLPLRVENLVPPESFKSRTLPTDPDFKHQWYLVSDELFSYGNKF
jgi:proprotein convertase subtilisin/kexin type 2